MCLDGISESDMARPRWLWLSTSVAALAFSGYLVAQQDGRATRVDPDQLAVEHPDCTFFGPQRERYVTDAMERISGRPRRNLSTVTDQVMRAMAIVPGGSQTYTYDQAHATGS